MISLVVCDLYIFRFIYFNFILFFSTRSLCCVFPICWRHLCPTAGASHYDDAIKICLLLCTHITLYIWNVFLLSASSSSFSFSFFPYYIVVFIITGWTFLYTIDFFCNQHVFVSLSFTLLTEYRFWFVIPFIATHLKCVLILFWLVNIYIISKSL